MRWLLVPLLVAVLITSACSSSAGDAALAVSGDIDTATDREPTAEMAADRMTDDDGATEASAQEPDPPQDDEPGDLLDATEVELGPEVVGHQVRYRSRSLDGRDIEVSGYVVAPAGEAPEGGWPVISWAHGTTGMADSCAPSKDPAADALLWQTITARGYAFAATDYEGLGTPGLHPYVVGESEGRGVLDIVRAMDELIDISDSVAVWGHSQGGHGALFAGQIWADWAPELNLVGVVAGAPPSQFPLLSAFLQGSDFQGYLVMIAAAFAEAYPELDLADILTPEALELTAVLDEGCTGEVFEVFNPLPYEQIASVDDPFAVPGWGEVLVANDTNQRPVPVPTLILHGGEDEQIPVASSALLLDQLCALEGSASVERTVYEGFGHAEVVPEYAEDMFVWLDDRFSGVPAESDCA